MRKLSVRTQLLISYLALVGVLLGVALASRGLLLRAERVRTVKSELNEVSSSMQRLFRLELEFALSEVGDHTFHETGQCATLENRQEALQKAGFSLEELQEDPNLELLGVDDELQSLVVLLDDQNTRFKQLVEVAKARGFRDYGEVGRMRAAAHRLEERPDLISPETLLTLRRHEKDFLLRMDSSYLTRFKQVIGEQLVAAKSTATPADVALLQSYLDSFCQVAEHKIFMGTLAGPGLLAEYTANMANIEQLLVTMVTQGEEKSRAYLSAIRLAVIAAVVLSILVALVMAGYFARKRAKPMSQLVNAIQQYKQDSNEVFSVNLHHSSRELDELYRAFATLLDKLRAQIDIVQEKSRTLEAQNAELKQVNQELDRFVYSVSHDLRSPISSMLGLINLAKTEQRLELIKTYLDHQEKSVLKLDAFIGDIVDFSKNSRLEVEQVEVDLEGMLLSIFDNYRHLDPDNSVQKDLELDSKTFGSDPTRVKVILSNLLSNSLRFVDVHKEERYIRVSSSVSGLFVTITVEDNGIGIPKDHQERIFDMFYRATTHKSGSGLGLYIVRETLKKLDGEIELQSTYGEGTKVTLTLPNHATGASVEQRLLPKSLFQGLRGNPAEKQG